MSTRDRRVTLALKYHHLDNLSAQQIRDKFEREGVGDYAVSTIRSYLASDLGDEVVEQIEREQADVRTQIADRYERLYQKARNDAAAATTDETITAVVPQTTTHEGDDGITVHHWEQVDSDDEDWPVWADDHDLVIRFTDGKVGVEPGDTYPVGARRGTTPEYRRAVIGVQRDQPDLSGRTTLRREAAQHLEKKARVLGAWEEEVSINGEIQHNVDATHDVSADFVTYSTSEGTEDEDSE